MAEKLGIRPATIVIEDKKVLLVKSKYSGDPYYLFPGGGMENTETIEDAAIRETLEETGVKVELTQLFHVNEYIDYKDWEKRVLNIFFLAKIKDKTPTHITDEGKILSVDWIPASEFHKHVIKPARVAKAVKEYIEGKEPQERYTIDFKNKDQ